MNEASAARLWLARTGIAGCILMAAIVVSSAYLRFAKMGIGCEPWPACYGRVLTPAPAIGGRAADHDPTSVKVARVLHRAAAMLVAIVAVLAVLLALVRGVRRASNGALAAGILGLTITLAAVGRVSAASLVPAIGVANLLGGFGLLACFWALRLNNRDHGESAGAGVRPGQRMAAICLLVFALQAAVGALISVTYSAALCPSLWICDSTQAQAPDLAVFSPQPIDANAKVLPARAVAGMQTAHRMFGVAAAALFALFGLWLLRVPSQRMGGAALLALAPAEAAIAIVMASRDFPLLAAILHNALAALLLLVLVSLAWPRVAASGHAVCG